MVEHEDFIRRILREALAAADGNAVTALGLTGVRARYDAALHAAIDRATTSGSWRRLVREELGRTAGSNGPA